MAGTATATATSGSGSDGSAATTSDKTANPPPSSSGTRSGTFTLLLFASASTYAGGIETLTLPAPTTLREVFGTLEQKFRGFEAKVLRSAAVTVNLEYVDFDFEEELDDEEKGSRGDGQKQTSQQQHKSGGRGGGHGGGGGDAGGGEGGQGGEGLDLVIHDGDEVGIIPPVSSG